MAAHSRSRGLSLLALGTLVFAGTTNHLLPAVAFWPALLVCAIGVVLFMKGNRVAMEQAEKRTHQTLHPPVRSEAAERFAERQVQLDGRVLEELGQRETRGMAAQSTEANQVGEDEIVLYEVNDENAEAGGGDGNFVVTTDVSFPLEVQQQTSLADQLQKLQQLRRDEIITPEEFAIAKAKLLA